MSAVLRGFDPHTPHHRVLEVSFLLVISINKLFYPSFFELEGREVIHIARACEVHGFYIVTWCSSSHFWAAVSLPFL
jgi:hypothetical protein